MGLKPIAIKEKSVKSKVIGEIRKK